MNTVVISTLYNLINDFRCVVNLTKFILPKLTRTVDTRIDVTRYLIVFCVTKRVYRTDQVTNVFYLS